MAAKVTQKEIQSDHDILIELRTVVIGLRTDITNLNDNSKAVLNDHEARLRKLEDDCKTQFTDFKNLNAEFMHQVNVNIPKILSDSDATHKRIYENIEKRDVIVSALVADKQGLLGGLKIVHLFFLILGSLFSGVASSFLIYFLTKH